MGSIISWLSQPLFQNSFIRVWMVITVGAALVLLLVLALVLVHKKRKKKKAAQFPMKEPVTEQPEHKPVLEIANLQGLGNREEQQDAFGISCMDQYESNGILSVLCDGMGGMAEGGRIAAQTAEELIDAFPWEENFSVTEWIRMRSNRVYQQFRGHGGTTLVAAVLREDRLSFWCVGDSDLFLLREGKLHSLNIRQEYKYDLVLRALDSSFPIEEAYSDPQAGALSEYIGKEEVRCDYTRLPLVLRPEDTLLLCSDGVSDTLTLKQIRETMALTPHACCDKLEEEILAAGVPNQDNYTAILLKYHGKQEENE